MEKYEDSFEDIENQPDEGDLAIEKNLAKTTGFGPYLRLGAVGIFLTALVLLVLGLCKNCQMSYIPAVLLGIIAAIFIFLGDKSTAKSAFISGLLILIIGLSLHAGNVC